MDSWGPWLRTRLVLLALVDDAGKLDVERVVAYLGAMGVAVSARTVEAWMREERIPLLEHLDRLLDALGVHGDARLDAYRMAATAIRSRGEAHEPR